MAEKIIVGNPPWRGPIFITGRHRGRPLQACVLLVLCACLLTAVDSLADTTKHVRVAIIQDAASLNLSIKGLYRIIDLDTKHTLSTGKHLSAAVCSDRQGILVKGISYKTSRIFIEADDPESIIINNRIYRGNIEVVKKDNGHLLAVNFVDMEDYIKGVLYNEVSHYWPMEALKAQAIASRSYAVYHIQENKLKNYDVTCDISQLYGGRASERYRTDQAVDATKGRALIYQNKVIPAYFYTTCGGHTEDTALVWNINILPLKGVPCRFCKDSPHFSWHCVLSLREIKNKLSRAGFKMDKIKEITVINRDDSGRIKELKVTAGSKEIKLLSKDFRSAIGPNIIRSTNFKVEIAGSDAVFDGFGWGHGVGMCQWGAYFMAKQGYNYKEILSYYYPGAVIDNQTE